MPGYRDDFADQYVATADDRRLSVFPRLLERIARMPQGAGLLDYGGGDGEFAALCTQSHLGRIATYDLSSAMNDLAERRTAELPQLEVLRTTDDHPDGSFDVVTCNGVWMCWTSDEDCLTNLREIARLLVHGGTFLAAVTHPCFRDRSFATFRTDFDPSLYLADGTPFRVTMFDGTREVELEDTHWSLGAMTRQLLAANLQLREIEEVPDRGGAAGCPWMIVEARRV